MGNRYDTDKKFDQLRVKFKRMPSSGLHLILFRIIIGAISGVSLLSRIIPKLGPVITQLNDKGENAMVWTLIGTTTAYVLLVLLVITEVILFIKKKKQFIFVYIVMAAAFAVVYFLGQPIHGFFAIIIETLIIAYLLTSKHAAIYFRYYNKF